MFKDFEEYILDSMLIEEENFFIKKEAKSYREIIKEMGEHLFNKGYVKDSFTQAVLDREDVYPTGLQTIAGGVAIPHTDSKHVLTSALSIATLKEPVDFRVMAEPEKTVPVSVVMMLAVADPKKVVPVLRKVISIVEDQTAIEELISAVTKQQAMQIVISHIKSHNCGN